MRKRYAAFLFLILLATSGLYAGEKEPAAFSAEISGGSCLFIPHTAVLLNISFPLGSTHFRIAAQAGCNYLFNVWDAVHAGNFYFPMGFELSYIPMHLGFSCLYHMSLSDITGEGIIETSFRTYLDLVIKPRFEFQLFFSLGLSAFWDYNTQPVFPVTADIGLRFRFPFRKSTGSDST